MKPLQQLDLSRPVKKEINDYLLQLPQRCKKVRLYPALLQQLATIQQQALQEIEQPKTGFLQKILGGNNSSKDEKKVDEENNTSAAPAHEIKLEASNRAPDINQSTPQDVALLKDNIDALNHTTTTSVTNNIVEKNDPQTATLSPEFINRVTQIINQFLVGLEQDTALAKKAQIIRDRINSDMTVQVFIRILETLRDMVMHAYLSANQAFATYLKNVNQELNDIYGLIGGAVQIETSRQTASESLQHSVLQEMASLESSAEMTTDLAQLKSQVKSQIGNIRHALDNYQQAEQSQQKLATQLEALSCKIKSMENDAEKNRDVLEKQRHKALHDPLTELPNREFYNERAANEYQRWQRYSRPLTIAIFDIDKFKGINDNYGHQAGDRVLKVISRSIAKRLREVDFFCRFGGEEFVALMPETNIEDAMQVLDKIRAAIANAAFNYKDKPLVITLSVGATEFKSGDDLESAFVRADEALYVAKSSGRNCSRSA